MPGLHRMKAEQLDRLRPDTIVVFDAHWHTTVEFVVAAHDRRSGLYTSEELPRGMCQMPYDFPGDPELARLIAEEVDAAGSWMTPIDDPCLPIHYPTTNLLPFLQGDERWVSVSTAQTAETDDFLLVGEAIGRAVARSGRRVVLLASGAMSHTFWKLTRAARPRGVGPGRTSARPRRAPPTSSAWRGCEAGDHARVIDTMPEFLRYKPEAMFGHYLMMVGGDRRPRLRRPGRALQRVRELDRHRPGPHLVQPPDRRLDRLTRSDVAARLSASLPSAAAATQRHSSRLATPRRRSRTWCCRRSGGSSGRCGSRGRSRRPRGRCRRCRCRRTAR